MNRWTEEQVNLWWDKQEWPLGINYVTSDAVNDIEMWMNDTFHPELIGKELRIARKMGYRSVRVFLSYAVWQHEGKIFEANFERFLQLAADAGVSVMPILFDDCAFDKGSDPVYGPQLPPVSGVHNSRWVPSPGFVIQDDPAAVAGCKAYVDAIIGQHREDPRILLWDLSNEPGNTDRLEKCLPLLSSVFEWARALDPVQPLTAGVWRFDASMEAVNRYQWEQSDVISLHAYTPLEKTMELVQKAQALGRPVIITEWLHRPNGNTLQTHLPYFKAEKIGAWQWGMLVGRTQTNLSWNTMNGGTPEPDPVLWQHDVLWPDGTPYSEEEVALIRQYTE